MNQKVHLDFEEPILKLARRIEQMRTDGAASGDVSKLESKLERVRQDVYGKLTAWQKTQIARHPSRPYTMDYLRLLFSDFFELHGDRKFRDDPAMVCGFATFAGRTVAVVGHQKGRDTKQNLHRNFGMPSPEGYRKALRIMEMAARFSRPILTFIDTPGAYPGIGAEERGQAEAIAQNLRQMFTLGVPIVVAVIGEGGSGGALAIGVGDRVLMLECATYSVISPEACSSILFKTSERAPEAAEALKLTAHDLRKLGVVDAIVAEPPGGAHTDPAEAARLLGQELVRSLDAVEMMSTDERMATRYEKFRRIGVFEEPQAASSESALRAAR